LSSVEKKGGRILYVDAVLYDLGRVLAKEKHPDVR